MVFPLSGPWGALQGPPCPAPGNHHCGTANQQFAYDFVPLDVYGNPNPNACIGQPILSPTDGIVVEALDAYPNALSPGQHIAGNHIVIQRSPSEYILIAHLSPGTLTVGTGATVAAGQVIGACGYNGNTSAPHVHIHMQAGPVIMNFCDTRSTNALRKWRRQISRGTMYPTCRKPHAEGHDDLLMPQSIGARLLTTPATTGTRRI